MSIDYRIACYDCKDESPIMASGSGFYGFRVWLGEKDWLKWLGHKESVGHHERHDLRIVSGDVDLPWADDALGGKDV